MRVGSCDLVLGKTRKIRKANLFAHRAALFADSLKTVVTPEATLLINPFWRVPLGPLPAESITVHGAGLFEGIVEWGDPDGPACFTIFTGQVWLVHLLVLINGFGYRIIAAGPAAVPAWIHITHIDLGLAVHQPLCQVLATARPLGNADRSPTAQPVVLQALCRPQQKAPIRGVGDGPIHHALDTSIGPARDAL